MSRSLLTSVLVFSFLYAYLQEPVQPEWTFARTGSSGNAEMMLSDSSSNIYIAGYFYEGNFEYQGVSVSGINSGETNNLFILKTNQAGKLIWLHSIQGIQEFCDLQIKDLSINEKGELSLLYGVSGTPEIIVANRNYLLDETWNNSFITKFSKTGFALWTMNVHSEGLGKPETYLNKIILDEEGSIYAGGSFTGSNIKFGSRELTGLEDEPLLFLCKVLPEGNVEWIVKSEYDVNGDNGSIFATDLAFGANDELLIAGHYDGYRKYRFGRDSLLPSSTTSAYLASYKRSGEALWGYSYVGDKSDFSEKILIGSSGYICYIGLFNSNSMSISGNQIGTSGPNMDAFIALYDENGNYVNSRTIGLQLPSVSSEKEDFKVRLGEDNMLYIASEFFSPEVFSTEAAVVNTDTTGSSDIVVAKINIPDLSLDWALSGAGSGYNYLEHSTIDRSGNITIAGSIYKEINYDGTIIPANSDNGGIYMANLHRFGGLDYTYRNANDTSRNIYSESITSDFYGNIYLAGRFNGTENYLDDKLLTTPDGEGFFVAKYGKTTTIAGNVLREDALPATSGHIKLIGYTFRQKSPIEDSVVINGDGSFIFDEIPAGRYILHALPPDDETTFIPTYYPDAQYWEDAQQILVNPMNTLTGIDIYVPIPEIKEGTSRLSGIVSEITEADIFKSTYQVLSKPKPKSRAKLASKPKATYDEVYYAETDESGYFEFNNIPNGYYHLFLDETGLENLGFYEVTVTEGYFYSSLDFYIDEETVEKTGSANPTSLINSNFKNNFIYPNPSSGLINLDNTQMNFNTLKIYDSSGREVYSQHLGSDKHTINLDLSNGNYIAKLLSDSEIKTIKLILF